MSFKQGGFVFVDHRASPGIPEDFARRMGYAPEQVREGALFEADTYTCPHCGTVVIKNPARIRARETCRKCNSFICDACYAAMSHPDYVHQTLMQHFEENK